MKTLDPCTLTFFGAGGNLSRRKLIPALFHLETVRQLPEHLVILGCDIAHYEREVWLGFVSDILRERHGKNINEEALQRRAGQRPIRPDRSAIYVAH